MPPSYPPLTPVYPATSTGRRLALARWITHRGQPADGADGDQPDLDAPLRHTAGPVGVRLRPQRQAPDDPGACSTGWPSSFRPKAGSMKPIHRLIVTSAAYRMESTSCGPGRPQPRPRPGQRLLLADEPETHGGRGRARQPSAGRGQPRSDAWAGPTSIPRPV